MEKKKITVTIFEKCFNEQPRWKDIKHIEFEDNDLISIFYDEGFYSENESTTSGWNISIEREREETDDEYYKRIEKWKSSQEIMKNMRYNSYLKLKEEFEK
jgi:hypothetical protein